MAATVSSMLVLMSKADGLKEQIASGWYKASQAMDLFPVRLTELRQLSEMYTSLLIRYGRENDSFIEQPLKEAIKLLEAEKAKLERLQDSCCWGMGTKLLFPDSVITAMDAVVAAYKSLSEHFPAREAFIQQLERSDHSRAHRLPFSQDDKYVPLQKSIVEVRTALENETTGRIVVISGGPGQGKSSMARYLGCLYQDGIATTCPAQSGQGPAPSSNLDLSPKRFADGVFFLRCGKKVNIKGLLAQLWQDIGFQEFPLSTSNSKGLRGDQKDFQDEERVLKQLSTRLRNQKVLIILDDLWDPMILDKLMVQGKWVTYLITTQVPRIRNDATEIRISKPDRQEANRIVANYVIGCPRDMVVSTDVKAEIDAIIEKSDSNPLVLANVATNLRFDPHDGEASQLAEWKSTRRYLADLQDGDTRRPVSLYGRTYSKKTMGASMEMALNSFSSEELTLVCLASIFEAESIPEIVFKIAFKSLHSTLAKFTKYSKQLEAANFIEIENKTLSWTIVSQRSWSIHTMRQNFIKTIRKGEISLMFEKLCEQSKHDPTVGILLILYGQDLWRNHAASKMEVPLEKDDLKSNSTFSWSVANAFVWLLQADPHEEWEKTSHQIATQILYKYLHSCDSRKQDISDEICKLLAMKETIWYGCEAIKEWDMFETNLSSCLKISLDQTSVESLLEFIAPHCKFPIQQLATLTLGRIAYVVENALKIGQFPHALERLVGLLQEGGSLDVQSSAAQTLGAISYNVKENAIKIGQFPHAVERLVGLLQEGVSPDVQSYVAWTLGVISFDVMENAIKIGQFPHALERLIGLLQKGVSLDVQADVAWTLGAISYCVTENAIKIGQIPHALERLVGLLQEGVSPDVQGNVAWTLGVLSKDVTENATKIGQFPHVVERLVGLLQEGVSLDIQGNVALTLGIICENVLENAIKIGQFPHAVERLVGLLQVGVSPDVQKSVAWTLGVISIDMMENANKIGQYPHAVERLVGLLQEGVSLDVQGNAALTLGVISKDVTENAIKIGQFPHAVERLVELLQEGVSPHVQGSVALTLGIISKDVMENAIKVGQYPHAVERLVGLLQEGVRPDVQKRAAWTLGHISKDVMENAIKMRQFGFEVSSS